MHYPIKSAGEIVVAAPVALWLSRVTFDLMESARCLEDAWSSGHPEGVPCAYSKSRMLVMCVCGVLPRSPLGLARFRVQSPESRSIIDIADKEKEA